MLEIFTGELTVKNSITAITATLLLLVSVSAIQAQPEGSNTYSVEKGDVIIEVNGTKIVKVNQYQKLIRHSNPDIYFTVRKTNGKEVSLHAVLKNRVTCNSRFAIDIAHNRGDGVRVTVVAPRSPARVCSLVTSQE